MSSAHRYRRDAAIARMLQYGSDQQRQPRDPTRTIVPATVSDYAAGAANPTYDSLIDGHHRSKCSVRKKRNSKGANAINEGPSHIQHSIAMTDALLKIFSILLAVGFVLGLAWTWPTGVVTRDLVTFLVPAMSLLLGAASSSVFAEPDRTIRRFLLMGNLGVSCVWLWFDGFSESGPDWGAIIVRMLGLICLYFLLSPKTQEPSERQRDG